MEAIDRYIDEVLIPTEGGYSNHPSDPGGETMWGITKKVATEFGYKGDMKDMPKMTAHLIYKSLYWTLPNFNRISDIAPDVALEMIDTGVNMGPFTATTFLQRWLNAYNHKQEHYKDINVDGKIGPATLSALKAFKDKRGLEGLDVLMISLNCVQAVGYLERSERMEKKEDFLYGWMKHRVVDQITIGEL